MPSVSVTCHVFLILPSLIVVSPRSLVVVHHCVRSYVSFSENASLIFRDFQKIKNPAFSRGFGSASGCVCRIPLLPLQFQPPGLTFLDCIPDCVHHATITAVCPPQSLNPSDCRCTCCLCFVPRCRSLNFAGFLNYSWCRFHRSSPRSLVVVHLPRASVYIHFRKMLV